MLVDVLTGTVVKFWDNVIDFTLTEEADVIDFEVDIQSNKMLYLNFIENANNGALASNVCYIRFNDNTNPNIYRSTSLSSQIDFTKRNEFCAVNVQLRLVDGYIFGFRDTLIKDVGSSVVAAYATVFGKANAYPTLTKITFIKGASASKFQPGTKIFIRYGG